MNFVNPLFWMIPKVLKKLEETQCRATIIAPRWTSQHWFRKLVQLSVGPLTRILNTSYSCIQVISKPEPRKIQAGNYMPGKFVGSKTVYGRMVKSQCKINENYMGRINTKCL